MVDEAILPEQTEEMGTQINTAATLKPVVYTCYFSDLCNREFIIRARYVKKCCNAQLPFDPQFRLHATQLQFSPDCAAVSLAQRISVYNESAKVKKDVVRPAIH
ncbi:hypothetical protein UY3_15482 [Chelonia mydas]|uniref:Uncharacterized protein n=1 Tax=Chelonia mydas TaxID=8469 RepID=M7BGQ5_CHEMY|nr:hypothetical protein UY3_15482 [Chelonia mydas]